jgi:hypothetical protein
MNNNIRPNVRPVILTDAELIAMGALIDDDAPAGGPRRAARPTGVVTSASVRRRAAWVA